MKASIRFYAGLSLKTGLKGKQEILITDSASVHEVIAPWSLGENDIALVFINGSIADMNSPVREGDMIQIFPPLGGG
jgi:molybdopterin converting factor small subunit